MIELVIAVGIVEVVVLVQSAAEQEGLLAAPQAAQLAARPAEHSILHLILATNARWEAMAVDLLQSTIDRTK